MLGVVGKIQENPPGVYFKLALHFLGEEDLGGNPKQEKPRRLYSDFLGRDLKGTLSRKDLEGTLE